MALNRRDGVAVADVVDEAVERKQKSWFRSITWELDGGEGVEVRARGARVDPGGARVATGRVEDGRGGIGLEPDLTKAKHLSKVRGVVGSSSA